MAYKNNADKVAAASQHYQNNKEYYAARNRAKKERLREVLRELKNKPCSDCGICYPYYVMDFDHRPGETKRFNLGNSIARSERLLREEAAKCDLVCANCHRQRTHDRSLRV